LIGRIINDEDKNEIDKIYKYCIKNMLNNYNSIDKLNDVYHKITKIKTI